MEKSLKDLNAIKEVKDARLLSPLVLAYMGDCVYEIYVRRYLICKYGDIKVNDMHKKATGFVKAKAQAMAVMALKEELDDAEWAMVKKGRNQKSCSMPKNAQASDYRYATGFETLIGYLYLSGLEDKLEAVIEKSIKLIENQIQ